jgi:hypothetical protein
MNSENEGTDYRFLNDTRFKLNASKRTDLEEKVANGIVLFFGFVAALYEGIRVLTTKTKYDSKRYRGRGSQTWR